jgi:hypothetical protein
MGRISRRLPLASLLCRSSFSFLLAASLASLAADCDSYNHSKCLPDAVAYARGAAPNLRCLISLMTLLINACLPLDTPFLSPFLLRSPSWLTARALHLTRAPSPLWHSAFCPLVAPLSNDLTLFNDRRYTKYTLSSISRISSILHVLGHPPRDT